MENKHWKLLPVKVFDVHFWSEIKFATCRLNSDQIDNEKPLVNVSSICKLYPWYWMFWTNTWPPFPLVSCSIDNGVSRGTQQLPDKVCLTFTGNFNFQGRLDVFLSVLVIITLKAVWRCTIIIDLVIDSQWIASVLYIRFLMIGTRKKYIACHPGSHMNLTILPHNSLITVMYKKWSGEYWHIAFFHVVKCNSLSDWTRIKVLAFWIVYRYWNRWNASHQNKDVYNTCTQQVSSYVLSKCKCLWCKQNSQYLTHDVEFWYAYTCTLNVFAC